MQTDLLATTPERRDPRIQAPGGPAPPGRLASGPGGGPPEGRSQSREASDVTARESHRFDGAPTKTVACRGLA